MDSSTSWYLKSLPPWDSFQNRGCIGVPEKKRSDNQSRSFQARPRAATEQHLAAAPFGAWQVPSLSLHRGNGGPRLASSEEDSYPRSRMDQIVNGPRYVQPVMAQVAFSVVGKDGRAPARCRR